MKKCSSINNSLRARSISKTYQPAFFHLGECATYQPAIDQSDWPIQTVIVQPLIAISFVNEIAGSVILAELEGQSLSMISSSSEIACMGLEWIGTMDITSTV